MSGDWVKTSIPYEDYRKRFAHNPDVRLISDSKSKTGWVDVLVKCERLVDVKPKNVSLDNYF